MRRKSDPLVGCGTGQPVRIRGVRGPDHLPVKSHEPDASEKDYWAGWSEVLTPEGQWVAAPDGL